MTLASYCLAAPSSLLATSYIYMAKQACMHCRSLHTPSILMFTLNTNNVSKQVHLLTTRTARLAWISLSFFLFLSILMVGAWCPLHFIISYFNASIKLLVLVVQCKYYYYTLRSQSSIPGQLRFSQSDVLSQRSEDYYNL